jgi:antitoxin MazE3
MPSSAVGGVKSGSDSASLPLLLEMKGFSPMVPVCYHIGMSKQIAVRLPEELVEFVDRAVASGDARSRASVVTRALERERRRAVAEKDAEILARTGSDPELAGLAEHAAGVPSTLA